MLPGTSARATVTFLTSSAASPHICHPRTFSLKTRRPPPSTLFPYTTLFRSHIGHRVHMDRLVLRELPAAVVAARAYVVTALRSEEHTSELQSHLNLVCRLLLEKKNNITRLIASTGASTDLFDWQSTSSTSHY